MTAPEHDKQLAAHRFYSAALDEAEQIDAHCIDGVDEELALLRDKLHRLVQERPEEHVLMLKSVEMIVRTVAARYRMSPKRIQEMDDSMMAVLTQVSDAVTPMRFRDV
jgi:hypothetical protein